jgi:hypothetical protein
MNEIEKDRILQLVAQGIIKPAEGASLLAALSEAPPPTAPVVAQKPEAGKPKVPASKPSVMEVDMKRPDGSHHKIEVPSNLFPMFWAIASESIKESTKVAAQETWQGFKNIVRNKTTEVRDGVKTRIASVGTSKKVEEPALGPTQAEERRDEARRQILQMVQNGRLTADDAGGLIQQLDALHTYEQQTS